MADLLNLSRPVARILSLRRNLAHAVTPRKNTCTATMVKNNPNFNAKSARQTFNLTTVLENHLKQNISVRTVSVLYSVGKDICTLLLTNAATITVLTASTLSKNSTRQNEHCLKQNLHNLKSATSIANTYSKPKNFNIPHRSNRWLILLKSTTPKISLA